MTFKQKALKGIVILAVVLLVSMFFSKTIQTITTPKIQKISATRGKLEDKIPVNAKLDFLDGEPIVIKDAQGLGATVSKITAKTGYSVKKGDLLAELIPTDYESKIKPLKDEYMKGVRKTTERIAKSIRIKQSSEHNDAYNAMLHTADAYFVERIDALLTASKLGYDINPDVETWGIRPIDEAEQKKQQQDKEPPTTPAPVKYPDEKEYPGLADKMKKAYDAFIKYDEAKSFYRDIYQGKTNIRRVGDGTFEYIKERDSLIEEVQKAEQAVVELESKKNNMQKVYAPRDGFLTDFSLKVGDSYDGIKPLYHISQEGDIPMLYCDITDIKKTVKKGMKLSVEGLKRELSITDIKLSTDNKKIAYIKLSEKDISNLGGLSSLMNKDIPAQIIYKADKTTTLIPASALRTDSDGSNFVFVVNTNWGGMLSNASETVKKYPVKVIEKSDKVVSVEEDLMYQQIADNEDRTIKDGQQVMEYVN
ncbi:MAG: hypothetical protein Q4E07_05740 [Eubacteriales bacterium]|nr:hypothetical protein [Eubacteriales bacterium]